jgi:hypothetical protein
MALYHQGVTTMMKLDLMRTTTGKEDPVTSAAEDKVIRVTSLRNYSPNIF